MADNGTGQEKTEEATPKRLQEAQDKGQVARSRDLGTMLVTVGGSGGLILLGGYMGSGVMGVMRERLRMDRAEIFDSTLMLPALLSNIVDGVVALAPFFGLLTVSAIVGSVALGGWSFSGKSITPDFSRVNPLKGLKRLFGARAVVELMKALAKFAVVAASSTLLLNYYSDELLALAVQPLSRAANNAAALFFWLFFAMSSTLALIAAVDVPFQLWDNARKLRMTRQEVKDELKETEGNPEVRARLRGLQLEASQRRMMEDVPDADVVVVNPTHFAVALKYQLGSRGAPRVVARGADLLAFKIRQIATQHHVAIFSAPPLARALYHSADIGKEIPVELYIAVAKVLAYVHQIRLAASGNAHVEKPFTDFDVPEEFH